MKDKIKYFKCPICGNVIEVINGDIKRIKCCDKTLELLVANTIDASLEKHVPTYEIDNNEIIVKVGEVIHPMEEAHHIEFIILETNKGHQVKYLKPGEEPKASFMLANGEEVVAVYEYCNLHGLWKK